MKISARIGLALALLASTMQAAAACETQPADLLGEAAYHLEMRIVAARDLPASGDRRNCWLTIDVLRVMRAPAGFAPDRREVRVACGVPGQWRTTCPRGSIPVSALTVGRRFTAGLMDTGRGTLGIIETTFRPL